MAQAENVRHLAALRERIRDGYRTPEPAAVAPLIDEAALAPDTLDTAQALAAQLAQGVRANRTRAGGVDALMLEFSLDSREGIALMCVAEALLRIPDAATRDRLIRDKIGQGDWRAHVGRSPSLFVNAAAWGLLVTGKLVDTHSTSTLEAALGSLLRKGGEPLIRAGVDVAMRLLGRQFVLGRTIEEALANAAERAARGYRFSFDMLGEAALTAADAQRYHDAYAHAIDVIGKASASAGPLAGPGISIKLSALHPRYVRAQRERVMAELLPRVIALCAAAKAHDIGLNIDAEETDRLELSLDLFAALAAEPSLADWDGLGFVVQAYQKRARAVIDWLVALGRAHRRRLMVRLVKGAYWDAEIKRAQVDGLPDYPVFTRKAHTDVSYVACARAMLAAPDAIYPQFASHNAFTIAAVHALGGDAAYEFQCLHGMGESMYDQVVGRENLARECRIYAPVGSHETLLAYLVRRLLENGANSSFVNRVVDPAVPIADLVADPVTRAREDNGAPHPRIALPPQMFADRRNSLGDDLSDERVLARFAALLAAVPPPAHVQPLLAADSSRERTLVQIRNPADRREVVGAVHEADAEDARAAVTAAAASDWPRTPVAERAACLMRAADLLEAERDCFVALAVREAGKTLPNALGEVREAVDFCRYYAAQAQREMTATTARGPLACIAPWNFPLAIFVGQVSAALVTGNPVLAKPAEQTPLIATAAVDLLHRAGVPRDALHCLPGRGEIVGDALVRDPRIAGVLFTGSTEVARLIAQALAARADDPVLIAETGGQNALIADSSSLPEQVVADALASAFDSAGQRCSALRVLCVQEDVAERTLAMLRGALREWQVGDPRALATDVGPVIDDEARARLVAYVDAARARGATVEALPLPAECKHGTFMAPTLIALDDVRSLTREVFGPVLHLVRYREGELDALVDALNATGYGLTHGIHSRIDETVARIAGRVRAGNVYVNRTIVGAVVGVQPFGGEGLSGTGPKAGGPHYLWWLVREPAPLAAEALAAPVPLPGPTGETNTLQLVPRGRVACLAPDERELARQVALANRLGNAAVIARSAFAGSVGTTATGRCEIVADPLQPLPDAVLFAGTDDAAAALRGALAARPGPLVPLVVAHDGAYDAARLVTERTLSINTTASGGNASLLSLEEREPA